MVALLLIFLGTIFFIVFLASGWLELFLTIITGDKSKLEEDFRNTGVCEDKLPPWVPKSKNPQKLDLDDFPPIRKAVVPWKHAKKD